MPLTAYGETAALRPVRSGSTSKPRRPGAPLQRELRVNFTTPVKSLNVPTGRPAFMRAILNGQTTTFVLNGQTTNSRGGSGVISASYHHPLSGRSGRDAGGECRACVG